MADERITFNGIDGTTGEYLMPPLTISELSHLARGETLDAEHLADLQARSGRSGRLPMRPLEGIDPKNLAETGWGVIFPYGADPAIRAALKELLDLRRSQASLKSERYYKEFAADTAYRPGETKQKFLGRFGAAYGPANPEKVPYYLLIVGPPDVIPFTFQYQLDVQYAVGRLYFDTLDEYAQYAHSVVAAETGKLALAKRAAFFGVQNPDDGATALSAEHLVKPLAAKLAADQPSWNVQTVLASDATKARLGELLGGKETPAFLFTASHGMGFPKGDARQLPHQGAFLCQDWSGPRQWKGPISPDCYFSKDDVGDDARLAGLISFHFACYGMGTPYLDDYAAQAFKQPAEIAPRAFLAGLPRRLLGHPKGGALATIGHVERAWGYSFVWERTGEQLDTFQSTFKRLVEGHPVGSAAEYLNDRYAELASDLSVVVENAKYGTPTDEMALAGMWTANNDARSYIIVGDPAVRLPVAESAAAMAARPTIELIRRPAPDKTAPKPSSFTSEPVAPGADATDYGLFDSNSLKEAQQRLATALKEFSDKLGQALEQMVDNATSMEVATYVSDNLDEVKYEKGRFSGPVKLRALTRVNLDGDSIVCVPEEKGEIDEQLWKIHSDMVTVAQANRAELLKAAVSAAAGLLKNL